MIGQGLLWPSLATSRLRRRSHDTIGALRVALFANRVISMTTKRASRTGRLRQVLALGALVALCCCGTPGETTSGKKQGQDATGKSSKSTAARTVQQSIDAKQWKSHLDGDSALAVAASAMNSPWQHAGVIEDDAGGQLTWAEYATSATAPRTEVQVVFRFCPKAAADGGGQTGGCVIGSDLCLNVLSTKLHSLQNRLQNQVLLTRLLRCVLQPLCPRSAVVASLASTCARNQVLLTGLIVVLCATAPVTKDCGGCVMSIDLCS